jgi:uncharacterized membrane protein
MGVAERFRENATGIASTVVTGTWLAMLFLFPGQEWWLAAMLFGYVVVVPVVAMLFGDEERESEWWDEWDWSGRTPTEDETDESARDALETLRERYARGELTDEQFERKLDRLLETESLEDAAKRAREQGTEPERETEREPER